MKLASVNPILYDFGVGFEDYMSQQEVIWIQITNYIKDHELFWWLSRLVILHYVNDGVPSI